ncbi:MAG: LpxI family protein [Planctomycetota bacterium]|jgi:DUF1009 family protein
MENRILGLIAGQGRLPLLVAQGMKATGARVCAVGLREHFDPALPSLCDFFDVAGVYRIGRWISTLRRHGAVEAVLVGRVSKARMHDPLRLIRQMPDWRAAKLWYRRLRDDRRSSAVLAAVADELREGGITLVDSRTYVVKHLAHEGTLTCVPLKPEHESDIGCGWPLLQRVVELDIGQSIAMCRGKVLAVESLEGTDAMIERVGRLNGGAAWTLLKGPRDDHDMRADVPVIGEVTIDRLARAGAGCVALRAGAVIMIDKPQVIRAADEAGIPIVGVGESGEEEGTEGLRD